MCVENRMYESWWETPPVKIQKSVKLKGSSCDMAYNLIAIMAGDDYKLDCNLH